MTPIETDIKTIYFKLPYLGKKSFILKTRLKQLCEKFKLKSKIRLAFTSFKLSNLLSPKCKCPSTSHVVYKFQCASCNECYVGFTTRHFNTRVKEHLFTDKYSHVFKHLSTNAECKAKCNKTNFSIIDRASNETQLRLKEAIHIQWLNPKINQQKKSCKLTLII